MAFEVRTPVAGEWHWSLQFEPLLSDTENKESAWSRNATGSCPCKRQEVLAIAEFFGSSTSCVWKFKGVCETCLPEPGVLVSTADSLAQGFQSLLFDLRLELVPRMPGQKRRTL